MASVPKPQDCLVLLRRCGCSVSMIRHSKAVRDVAVRIAEKAHADRAMVEAGALLHDIGRCKTHGIRHGVEGGRIAAELGLPSSIIRIIERHLGAGIPRDEAVELGLPARDYMPQTLEEKIVAHADNLIDNAKQHPVAREIEKALQKGKHAYAQRLRLLHQELSALCGVDLDEL